MPMTATHHTERDLLLTEVQAAEFLNLSVRTLQSWRVSGSKIPFVRCGRAIRYRFSDLVSWIKANTVTSTSEADVKGAANDSAP